jgi:RNA polymerase sigma factor (sigma-70 family)
MSTEDSYLALLASLRAGEPTALRLLSQRYFLRLRGLVRDRLWARIKDEKDVQVIDSILDSLVRHHGTDQAIDREDAESLWHVLARIAIRHCNKHNKRSKRDDDRSGPVVPIGVPPKGPDHDQSAGFDPKDDQPTPAAAVEFADWLESFRGKLPPQEQQVLKWTLEGRSRSEMADLLNRKEVTVERKVKNVREELMKELSLLWDK